MNGLAAAALFVVATTTPAPVVELSQPPQSSYQVSETLKAKAHDPKWILRFTMGPMRTAYENTDLHIRTSKADVHVRNAELGERTSMGYYKVWDNENPLQFIDEPSNAFILAAEHPKSKWALTLSMQHPKVLITDEGHNSATHVQGMIDGKYVDQNMDLGAVFPQYRVSKGHMTALVGAEKWWTVTKGKLGEVTIHAGAAVGAHFGFSTAGYDGLDNAGEPVKEKRFGVLGPAAQLSQRLVYHLPKDRFTVGLAHYSHVSRLKYPFLDGTATHSVNFESLALQVGYRITGGKRD